MDDQLFALRRYATMILPHWRLIALMTVIGVAIALAINLSTPPSYEARAQVLLSGPRFQFDLEPRLRTNLDNVNNMNAMNVRFQTVAQIAGSGEVEAAVQQRLANVLPASRLTPQTLSRAISVRNRSGQEYVEIIAQWGDPQFAAQLANTWADETAKRIDTIYGASVGAAGVGEELAKARPAYEVAEQEVIRLSTNGPLEDVTQRVKAKEEEIKGLQELKATYLKVRAGSLYTSLTDLDQVIRDGETLQQQLSAPAVSASATSGDALAVMMLRARNYLPRDTRVSNDTPAPRQSDIRLSSDVLTARQSREDQTRDLAAMVQALRGRRVEIQSELEELGRELQRVSDIAAASAVNVNGDAFVRDDDTIGAALSRATSDLAALKGQLAALTQQREEAVRNRDVLKTSYSALLNKAEELRVAQAASGSQARMLQQAVPPASSLQTGRTPLFVVLAAVGGLLLGLLLALVTELLRPSRSRPPAAARGPAVVAAEPAASQL
jgi:uncharacterized protein involved in exopolysaccharide biosynthesis